MVVVMMVREGGGENGWVEAFFESSPVLTFPSRATSRDGRPSFQLGNPSSSVHWYPSFRSLFTV